MLFYWIFTKLHILARENGVVKISGTQVAGGELPIFSHNPSLQSLLTMISAFLHIRELSTLS